MSVLGLCFAFLLGCQQDSADISELFSKYEDISDNNFYNIGWDEGLKNYSITFERGLINKEDIVNGYIVETRTFDEENGYLLNFVWLCTEDGKVIENVCIDLQDEMASNNHEVASIAGVFYTENKLYIMLYTHSNSQDSFFDGMQSMLVELDMEEPQTYSIFTFPIGAYWNPCVRINNKIFMHDSDGHPVCEFDLITKEAYRSEAEVKDAQAIIDDFANSYEGEGTPHIVSFYATDMLNEAMFYTAIVSIGNDSPERLMRVHLAYESRKLIGYMTINESTGEITKDFNSEK